MRRSRDATTMNSAQNEPYQICCPIGLQKAPLNLFEKAAFLRRNVVRLDLASAESDCCSGVRRILRREFWGQLTPRPPDFSFHRRSTLLTRSNRHVWLQ
jgi:hypothetical protein